MIRFIDENKEVAVETILYQELKRRGFRLSKWDVTRIRASASSDTTHPNLTYAREFSGREQISKEVELASRVFGLTLPYATEFSDREQIYSGNTTAGTVLQTDLPDGSHTVIAHYNKGHLPANIIPVHLSEDVNEKRQDTSPQSHKLKYVEQKIKAAYDEFLKQKQSPTDEDIAAKLPLNSRGQPYVRETVNRYRNAMRKRGIEV